jgi:predicted DNA-binding protein
MKNSEQKAKISIQLQETKEIQLKKLVEDHGVSRAKFVEMIVEKECVTGKKIQIDKKINKSKISIRIQKEKDDVLESIASEHGISKAKCVELIIERALDRAM